MVLGRCAFPRRCAQSCSNSEAHGTSLSSARSFNLSWKLTQLAPFFEIDSKVFSASDLAACEASICWIWLDLLYLWAETQILLIAIKFIAFETGCLEEHLKWNRDDELSLAFDVKVWKWNCLSVGATSQDLGCLVKWRVPWVDELDFEELALNMGKSLC